MSPRPTFHSPDLWRRTIAMLAMGTGAAVLVGGWWLDIALLRSLHPDFANMKANTAVALAGAGLALWLLTEGASPSRRRIGRAGAWLTTAIGALTLAQYLLGWELDIDQLLVADTASGYGAPGRLAPNTALALVLLGLSLLFLDRQTRGGLSPAEWLALGAALLAWPGLLGYLFGSYELYRFSVFYAMALPTAALLLLLALGAWLARPQAGMMAVLAGASPGGHLARRLIPITLISLPLLEVVVGAGATLGYYDGHLAAALHIMLASVVLLTAIALIARLYHLLNLRQVQVERQNRLLAGAVEGTADLVIIADRDGTIEYVNPAFEQVSGYRSDEVVGRNPHLVKSGVQPAAFYQQMWRTLLAGRVFRSAFVNRRKDGSFYHEQKTVTPITDPGGNITHFVSTGKDITEQIAQQKLLRESDERFRATFEQAAVGIAHVAPDGRWLRVNQKLCDIVGYAREELLHKTFQDITHPDDLEADLAQASELLAGEISSYVMEKRYFRKDGSIVWINLTVSLVRGAIGAPNYFISVVEDISERKHAEEKTRLLQTIALTVGAMPDLDSALETVLREVCTATGWVYGEAWRPCAENAQLQFAAAFHVDAPGLEEFLHDSREFCFARGVGLPGRVWTTRRPAWIPDVTQDLNFLRAKLARKVGVRAALGVPVLAGEEVVAILGFFLHEARPEDERRVATVSAVAAQLGLVFHRKRMQESLQDSEARLRAIIEAAPECIKLLRANGTLVQINATGLAMLEADSAEAVLGHSAFDLVAPEYREQFRAFVEHAAGGGRGRMEFEIVGLKGGRRWVETHAVPFRSPTANDSRLLVAVTRDMSEQKRAERELLQFAHYDALTGLPNRLLFTDRLQQAMEHALRHERLVGVAMLDIDQFKKVNDSLGHAPGDALLQQVGERLRASLRPSDTVARLGGDEFSLVLADMAHISDATLVLQKIRKSLEKPFRVEGRELFVSASMGVTLFPFDDDNVQALLRNADIAMYRAKESGRNTWQFYAAEMTARARENLALETELHSAIERREFELHYQPELSLATGRIVAVEALARWRHPRLGQIAPDRFIPIAEESGLIVPLGEWVLRAACEQAQLWRAAGFGPLRVAVNLSARQCREGNFYEKVRRTLADTGLPPEALELEVTESLLLQKSGGSAAIIEQLNALGVRIAVDDFGTGYSSLSYLKRLPLDVLKIDRSFVRDIATDPDDAAIARAIITRAHSLGMEVVAEGVETREQQDFLIKHGCDVSQGYYFCKPLPPAALTPLLEKRVASPF